MRILFTIFLHFATRLVFKLGRDFTGGGEDCSGGCGWGRLCSYCSTGTKYILRRVIIFCSLLRVRNSRLGRVGKTADSSDNRKPPRWTMCFDLADLGRRLSTSELTLHKSLTRILPFNTFKKHSLMVCKRSLEMMTLGSLGFASSALAVCDDWPLCISSVYRV